MERLDARESQTVHRFTYLALLHVAVVVSALALAIIWDLYRALVLAAPSIVILISAALSGRLVAPGASFFVDRPRALEGDSVAVTVELQTPYDVPLVDIEFLPQAKLDHEGTLRALTSLRANVASQHAFRVIVDEWGVIPLGGARVRARDRFGLVSLTTHYDIVSAVRVHIHEEGVRSLVEPDRFRRLVGSHLSAERGDGCEIADIRPYQPGDRLQSLNWRISARNDEPWITLRHPDRSTTVVLLVDAYQRFGQQRADGLRRSVRATLGLARAHLSAQDPVGVMLVGQGMRWFPPELGRLHLHRLEDAMLELSTNRWSESQQSQTLLHRLIPSDAIVVGISPLVDNRYMNVLTSLRGRGQSVHVIEPVTHWPRHAIARRGRETFRPEMAWRIYSLQQQTVRSGLAKAGISVIPWDEDQPFDSALLGLRMSQRARRAEARR